MLYHYLGYRELLCRSATPNAIALNRLLKATSEAVLGRVALAYEALRPLVPTGARSATLHDGFCALPKGPGPGSM